MNRIDTIHSLLQQKGGVVFSIPPSMCVYDALQVMADKGVGALLVVENERLVGLVSERDYARKVILQGRSSKDTAVSEIMSSDVIFVTPRQTVDDCMKIMTESRVRHLPIMEEGRLVGIVSLGDLVKWIISAQEEQIQHLHAYISGSYPV
jgi:CBS domain-containing protein